MYEIKKKKIVFSFSIFRHSPRKGSSINFKKKSNRISNKQKIEISTVHNKNDLKIFLFKLLFNN